MRPANISLLTSFDGLIPTDVFEIRYDEDGLRVRVEPEEDGLTICFERVIGFRVLDEGDLLEFWSDDERSLGWVYEVQSGGWLELESTRSGFLSTERGVEYLVATQNYCVNVLAYDSPKKVDAP